MKRSNHHRAILALAAAIACLLSVVNPAAATTTTVTVLMTGGTLELSFNANPDYEVSVDLSGGTMHTCVPTNPTPVSHIVGHDDTTGNMAEVTALTFGHPTGAEDYHAGYFDFAGMEYQRRFRLSNFLETNNTGIVSGTHPNQTLTQHVEIEGEISTVTAAGPPCTAGETICHFIIELTLTGPYDRTTMTATLNGSGAPQVDFCVSPFAGLADGNVTITNLELSP